jgi:hypothetical protein
MIAAWANAPLVSITAADAMPNSGDQMGEVVLHHPTLPGHQTQNTFLQLWQVYLQTVYFLLGICTVTGNFSMPSNTVILLSFI